VAEGTLSFRISSGIGDAGCGVRFDKLQVLY
jgi:hypothetical protein